jgi:hypothetical protein
MINWIKDILGINEYSKSQRELQKALDEAIAEMKKSRYVAKLAIDDMKKEINFISGEIADVQDSIGPKYVIKKLDGYKNEHTYIELSMKIYILDNGCRKQNEPFVKSDSNGRIDEYDSTVGTDSKMRCYMLNKTMLTGYGNEEKFNPSNEKYEETFEYFFGRSYREIVEYMREFNYDRRKEELCTLNFYEI